VALTKNFVCIHGHFYQPLRENPFDGSLIEPSARPYPNWNVRISEECYRSNTQVPVLGEDGDVARKLNNYEWISFDFGPTLLDWLERRDPTTYSRIIATDRKTADRFSGHGSAMAQAYNHTILPLSNARDKRTQIRWGVADFEHRFGRRPEGMWLPEAAVDLETLQILSNEGILFTVLSPHQAASVRDSEDVWLDVYGGKVDSREPYLVELPAGKRISVFFYDGSISKDIAFDGLLHDGRILAKRLTQAFSDPTGNQMLVNVATDGETYGHHHAHGEMALARAIVDLNGDPDVSITNYGEFLSANPPDQVVRIIENSSWSCAHGVERWKSDCGCHAGPHPDWNQEWRRPLRRSLDFLRDRAIGHFEVIGSELFEDPWAARDAYIEVLLGGDSDTFLARHGRPELGAGHRERALQLLEIQRQAMLMYTSCGWFFEDVTGVETIIVLRHAGMLIDLTRRAVGVDMEPEFRRLLAEARSNVDSKTGRDVFDSEVARLGGDFTGEAPLGS
jgi:alpha-amylase/alpha-mannosidase (GH57 family)